jgi:hypothetical protein
MAQIFGPTSNIYSKLSIVAAVLLAGSGVLLVMAFERSPYKTNENMVYPQPIKFSHDHHVAGLGLDCRYCHTSVEKAGFAGMPATKTCMTCHSQVWTNAPLLEPVRASWRDDKPIQWTRVHDLPDFVQFNHGIHVQKGIGCYSCHGDVGGMPLMWKTGSLLMEWCLDCHKAPEKHIRPRDKVFVMADWLPEWGDRKTVAKDLLAKYHVRSAPIGDPHQGMEFHPAPITNCSVCHY